MQNNPTIWQELWQHAYNKPFSFGLLAYREQQLANFLQKGWPTRHDEDWKYTDTAALSKITLQLPQTTNSLNDNLLKNLRLNGDSYHLVFINGQFAPQYSQLSNLPAKVIMTSLSQAWQQHADIVSAYLVKNANDQQQRFLALNSAFMNDGLFLFIPKHTVLAKPIQALYLNSTSTAANMCTLRNLIIAGTNSQASFVENYMNVNQGIYFTNAATQIFMEDNAQLTYYKLQNESEHAFHIGSTQIHQARDSQLRGFNFALGGKLVREDLNVMLNDTGASCALYGLYPAARQQHIDQHTRIDHHAVNTTSSEYYKGIITGKGNGVFNGKIVVHPQAQKTNAHLSNKNLLLAKTAEINTKPELEIYADDVKCAHGATVGQIDEAALFYLRSRGINEINARKLLTQAFANEILAAINEDNIKVYIHSQLEKKISSFDL